MPLKLSLGSTTTAELDISSDLSKHFLEEAGSITAKIPEIPNDAVSEIPPQFATLGFNFSAAPSWKIPQVAAITLTVKPQAGCKIAFLKSGATMCQFTTGAESPQQNPIKVRDGHCCVSISLSCSIGLEVGAKFSNGALGVSGSASADEQFRITYHHQVLPTAKVHDAITEAFRRFRLPFHSDGIDDMQDGSYLDAEFTGNLALGFGVTYGFAGIQLAGTSTGNVQAAANTPIGREVLTASPTFQVDAAFKLTYTHQDDFRVVAGRTNIAGDNKVTLYLMRKDVATLSSTESVGITLKAGAKFQTDPTTLNREIGLATQPYLGSTAGPLGIKLASAADPLATDVNSSVNQLLSKGDGQKMVLELMQSRASQDTALFIYDLDFTRPDKSGQRAYDLAMGGDYASAIRESGAKLDPRSFVEQQYLISAGIHLQLFSLLNFQDVTKYIDQNDVTYIGSRTFQIRSTEWVTEISGTSKKSQEADLYFVAECRNVSRSTAVSGASVKLQAIFIDKGVGEAFDHSARALAALGRGEEAESIRGYAHLAPHGTVRLAFNVPSQLFGKLQSDDYQNGHPAAEPHQKDQANYEAFTHAFADTYRPPDPTNEIFLGSFGAYAQWLNFNRVKNDQPGSEKPGDRKLRGDMALSKWPAGYPPSITETAERNLVQLRIYAAQNFMNFCDNLKHLAAEVPGVDDEQQYEEMLAALKAMTRDIPFPTYFLKPAVVALMRLVGAQLKLQGALHKPDAKATLALEFEAGAS